MLRRGLAILALITVTYSAEAAREKKPRRGRLVTVTVHGKGLEKTATGEKADRAVSIYLPPSYNQAKKKRYPVVYLLHGIADTNETWTHRKKDWESIQDVMDRGIAEGRFGEMIVVMPDERTEWFGSFYTNSASTGAWEDFTVKELVAWVDAKYRTIPDAGGRGIAGHSMGGHGALKLGMRHPDVYAAAYGLSPAMLGWGKEVTIDNPAFRQVLAAKSFEELLQPTQGDPTGDYKAGLVCVAQAFSPDPAQKPFFAQLPFELDGDKLRPTEAYTRWENEMPVHLVKTHRDDLLRLRGFRFDAGTEDRFSHIPASARDLSHELTALGIPHVYEEYNGDHNNRLWGPEGRIAADVLPWFWRTLDH